LTSVWMYIFLFYFLLLNKRSCILTMQEN
jgi:hypothetical protein